MAGHESTELKAYRLWEERGRPAGRELEFWLEAEAEVTGQLRATPDPAGGLSQEEDIAITNLDRALSPDKRREARAARSGGGIITERMDRETPAHFIVLLDRAHLRIYQLKEGNAPTRAQLELAESIDLALGQQRYTDRDTDRAGRFRVRGGPAGASIDERLPMQMEHERRLAAELADHVGSFLEEHNGATWDYAAGPTLHEAVLDHLAPGVRSRLEVALVKDLVHQQPAQLRTYFIS